MCGNVKVMTPLESCEKAIKSENIAYASHVMTLCLSMFLLYHVLCHVLCYRLLYCLMLLID
jgi:hypothetical protein